MKRNVWIINHHANDMYFDKGGRHYSIAKYLKLQGYDPIIFCSNAIHGNGDYYFDNEKLWQQHLAEEINVPFVYVKGLSYDGNGICRVLSMVNFYFNMIKTAKEYSKMFGKPDIIIASSVHPLAVLDGEKIAKFYEIPCVCEIRDLWPESIFAYYPEKKEKMYANILYKGEKYMYEKADAIVMTWPGGKDYIKDKGWFKSVDPHKIYYISNGVDLEVYDKLASDEEGESCFEFEESKFNVVYTGAIRKVNNLGMIVDAAKILQEHGDSKVKITIYGDGDELESLKLKCKQEKIYNIVFAGRCPKSQVPIILKKADCSIMHNTSTILNKYGQSQNKFFEYLAAGKPIIMTYSVGYSICAAEHCGIEVSTQNAAEICEAIEKMSTMDLNDYKTMCKSARKVAQKYDFKLLTQKYVDIIEKM